MRGIATERIKVTAPVLCRHGRVSNAPAELANGYAGSEVWLGEIYYFEPGDTVHVSPVEGLGDRDLQAMANGPIMDPNRIYLPAGKCSESEMRRREAWREER